MKHLLALSIFLLNILFGFTSLADEVSDLSLEQKVLNIIRNNPEIVLEAIKLLQENEVGNEISDKGEIKKSSNQIFEDDPKAPILGNPDGSITIVEFFDYNCGYCRKAFKTIMDLIKENKNIRVVMREWPILGEASVFAAKASLAAANQNKYEELHTELMNNRGRNSEKLVIEIANKIGINIEKLKEDMNSQSVLNHLQDSHNLSKILGINGTPAFVFGDQVIPGAIDLKSMRTLVGAMVQLK